MYNYSAGGLCYEADQPLEPEAEVCIVMDNYTPGRVGPEAYRSYVARIRWIQPLNEARHERYAAGAQIMARSHEILAADSDEPRHICDLCGVLMPVRQIECNEGNVQLCPQCNKHYHCTPEGKIRKCLDRFLIGNVV